MGVKIGTLAMSPIVEPCIAARQAAEHGMSQCKQVATVAGVELGPWGQEQR